MNNYEFVEVIKLVVRDGCAEGILEQFTKPSGRNPARKDVELSEWYNLLKERDKEMLKIALIEAIDSAIFGFFCVLDGVRAIENEDKGELELYYVKDNEKILLNDINNELLHDIYQGITQDT